MELWREEEGRGGREERKDDSGTDDPGFGTDESRTKRIDGDDALGCGDPSVPRNPLGEPDPADLVVTGVKFKLAV